MPSFCKERILSPVTVMASASGVPSFRPLHHSIRRGDRAAYEERQEYAADDPENEEYDARGGVEWRAGQDGFGHHAGHEPDSTQAVLEQESRTGDVPERLMMPQQHAAGDHRRGLQREVDDPHRARRGVRWCILNERGDESTTRILGQRQEAQDHEYGADDPRRHGLGEPPPNFLSVDARHKADSGERAERDQREEDEEQHAEGRAGEVEHVPVERVEEHAGPEEQSDERSTTGEPQ